MTESELLALIDQAEQERWTELDLSGQSLVELPHEIGRLVWLEELNLGYNKQTRRDNHLTALPASLANLSKLQSLNLRSNNLSELPGWLGQLANLNSLNLRNNNLNELPPLLANLTDLRYLNLSSNKLTQLPFWLVRLADLKSLDINNNPFGELPGWLGQLISLQSLDLSYIKLGRLPQELGQLTNLQSLYLHSNNLRELPQWLGKLTNLQSLGLNWNDLDELPVWLGLLDNLRFLSLVSINLDELPSWLKQLANLQSLNLGSNNLEELPVWLASLPKLQVLDLSGNKLSGLPAHPGQLTKLRLLDLSNNELDELPPWLGQLVYLQSLNLGGNDLSKLPHSMGKLADLRSLELSGNNFGELPLCLSQLSKLQSLNLSSNNLTALPHWLGKLTNLRSLYLGANKLTKVPEALVSLPQLQQLYLYDNPITEPSAEIVGADVLTHYISARIKGIKRYYTQLREAGTAAFYEAKLLIIGEGGSGKTSLARKLHSPSGELNPEEPSTEGIEIITWLFDLPADSAQDQYRVNIWDFGGQAIYFATHQFFLTRRSVYALVADTRLQHTYFYDWLRMQETFGGDSPVFLVKNRNRRHGNRFTIENLPQLRERFSNLVEVVVELDLKEVPNDAGWSLLLSELQKGFLGLEHVGKARPRTWVNVRQSLNEDERDTISRQQFLDLCYQHGVQHEADALQLSDYLHHLGDILHFQEDAVLNDVVILKPTWGLDAVYHVLDNEDVVDQGGRFSYDDLRTLWHEPRYEGHLPHLLRLMQNFQLCYPLPDDKDSFIAPQLLRDEVPNYEWDKESNLQLRFRYPVFMPRGILSRAIVKLQGRIEDQKLTWRSGVILNDGYARAEVRERRSDNEIRIRVGGRNKRDLLMEVTRALDDLHRGFPMLHYEKLIPCTCSGCTKSAEPYFFKMRELLTRLANRKKSTIECQKDPYEDVPIRSLLDEETLHSQFGGLGRENIYNIAGDFYASGDKQEGDNITVGDIIDSSNLAIGRDAQTGVSSETTVEEQSE